GEGGALVPGQQRTVGVHHPPPRHTAAPERHNAADLPGAAIAEELSDIAIGHHLAGRDCLHDIQHAAGVVAEPVVGRPALRCHWRSALSVCCGGGPASTKAESGWPGGRRGAACRPGGPATDRGAGGGPASAGPRSRSANSRETANPISAR